ncbi:hypothetical protein B0T24DRAFT_518969 [Lasiosphaeria ovina]|uniref:Ras-GAP domain-containing protein n=1 Tax=Lasiosphaeria ovina TaxID=92902 RepID=A0AAE0TYC4_9PEZI|nr:hypothetical protein B0T24DRAFT_518969 [Lasiosphaeria ovina]
MDGRKHQLGGPFLPERSAQSTALPPVAEMPSPRGMENWPASSLRDAFRPMPNVTSTVRAVTPEPSVDVVPDSMGSGVAQISRGATSASPQTSPRLIPGAGVTMGSLGGRRQGAVFHEAFTGSLDSASSSPPPRPPPSFRPRTHTMDGAFRQQLASAAEARHRMGSFSSSGSLPISEDLRLPMLQPAFDPYRLPDLQIPIAPSAPKDRKTSTARSRLTKRPSSRPTSPLSSAPPSVDSLPLPIPTSDANKVLLLMKNLCGRMRGEAEYQREARGSWQAGMCYIEEEKGSLMFDSGESGPFHTPLISDLRACRVVPVELPDKDGQCLEIASPHLNLALFLRPLVPEELDLWLAALLCWQQLRPSGPKVAGARSLSAATPTTRSGIKHRASSSGLREAAIIKIGKVMLWDKGFATSPQAIVKRPSTRDLRSSQTSWRKVSCILQDNGEFKLMTDNDVSVLSVIELSQLARSAIQQLDRSVLDEDYCIAIFPIYSSTSTQLSIFRPVYISLESRVLFEVWFVLLRAFTIPDVYRLDPANGGQVYEVIDINAEPAGETFRVEKTISIRITEAKIRGRTMTSDGPLPDRYGKGVEQNPLIGNYLAEVILDGEVRARTTTKMDTKNPFWREDCEFHDLPASLPYLSVLLKRVEGNLETFSHQLQATLGLVKTGGLTEVLCGSVDIPLHQLDRGKDHEQWLQVYDERQQSIGSMLVKVHHEELVVLLSKNYQPLSELLHRFSSGLTAQITEALPGLLRRVAEIFLNIFQVSGHATEWLMNMVEDEIDGIGSQVAMRKPRFNQRLRSDDSIDSTSDREQIVRDMGKSLQGEANLLFRGNSLLTQALEFQLRRQGREYLQETLADKILEINEANPNCEVDPGKLQPSDDIQQHWTQLINLTTEVWECIATSSARLPPELRHVLKYIRAVAEDRYGDFLRTVTYTSVSGFLFLRFICPAILNPKLFGLLRDHPRPRAQRTLTLIAKGLQALANLSTIGKKEMWMEPMNRFLNAQRQSIKDFLDGVCAIPVERTKLTLPASYSTPITILGRLSPVAREGFPSLPYLVDHARNFAALVKLWMDAHPVSTNSSRVYEGDLLEFHNLCTQLHRRAMECFAHIENLRAADNASQPGDDPLGVADAMDRLHFVNMLNTSPYGNSAAWMENEARPPGSSGSEVDESGIGGKEARSGRETSSLRQVSRTSDISSQVGTVRSLRARKFLSGFIRRTRMASPDPVAASFQATAKGRDRSRDQEREKGWEKARDRNGGLGLLEPKPPQ